MAISKPIAAALKKAISMTVAPVSDIKESERLASKYGATGCYPARSLRYPIPSGFTTAAPLRRGFAFLGLILLRRIRHGRHVQSGPKRALVPLLRLLL